MVFKRFSVFWLITVNKIFQSILVQNYIISLLHSRTSMEHRNCMRRGPCDWLQNHSSLQHVHLFESESVEFKFVVLAWFHNGHILSLVFVILVDQDSPFRDAVLIGFRKLFRVIKYPICRPFKNQTFIGLPSLKGNQNIYVFAQNIEVAILVLLLLPQRHFQSLPLQIK